MKKIMVIIMVLALGFSVLGCRSEGQRRIDANPNIPSFVANPPISDEFIYGVGAARMANAHLTRQAADARAMTDIAMNLSVEVEAMIIDYARATGTENNPSTLAFYESVSRLLTSTTLRGVEVVTREETADGNLWTLSRINKADAARAAAEILEQESALFAEFRAMRALEMMEYQLNRNRR